MKYFKIEWRIGDGSFYSQKYAAKSMRSAKARWRYYTGNTIRGCSIFSIVCLN